MHSTGNSIGDQETRFASAFTALGLWDFRLADEMQAPGGQAGEQAGESKGAASRGPWEGEDDEDEVVDVDVDVDEGVETRLASSADA